MALSIPDRPHDVDVGSAVTDSLLAVRAKRPPHTSGRCDCCHPEVEVAFLLEGATHATVGGHDVVLRPGQYLVIPSDVEHTTRTEARGSHGVYLQLRPDVLDGISDALGVAPWGRRRAAPIPISPEIHGALTALKHELAAPVVDPLPVETLGEYLAGALLRRAASREAEPTVEGGGEDPRLARAVELMHALPHERHSLASLAGAAGLSRFRFAHLFKARYEVSPHRYLLRLRTRLGAERLRESDASVTRVAHDLGFGSTSRFASAMRRHYGVSPSAYRRAHRSKI